MKYQINNDVLDNLKKAKPCFYANEKLLDDCDWKKNLPITENQIIDASERLNRFAKLIEVIFPETKSTHGIIESELVAIPKMQKKLAESFDNTPEILFLKKDSHLPVAGSVKARGGIYEILKYAEDLLIKKGDWKIENDYSLLAEEKYKSILRQYTIQVGSTGNLGMSIGIISAKLGFKVIVHMSSDAKQWKKDLLRKNDVTVIEYVDDYSKAVSEGRKNSDMDPNSYFVDDENSINLFLGYAVAALRLKNQLKDLNIEVSKEKPLVIYIPCGVGGAPGGVTYGCKYVFGENVYCYFVEPTQACCMILGMYTQKHNDISVQDIGLSGKTEADGLAVGRPSKLVGKLMEPILDGLFTVEDKDLAVFEKELYESENIFIEPSACAGFSGYTNLFNEKITGDYAQDSEFISLMKNATHIVWATGGSLVPEEEKIKYLSK